MTQATKIEDPTQQALQNAYAFQNRFAKRPFNAEGKLFLKLVLDLTHNIQKAMVGAAPPGFNLAHEIFILNTMISDPVTEIEKYFGTGEADYGIGFCEYGIRKLKEQELRLILSTGTGFPKGSSNAVQLENYQVMLKRFQGEKARGVAPSYNPKTFAQFA